MPLPSPSELGDLFNALFPDEESALCPACNKKDAAIIEIKCPCKFTMKSCASCLKLGRNDVRVALREHAATCDEGLDILAAMGF